MEGIVAALVALVEILAALFMFMMELTVYLAVAAVGPVRFCFSASYRKKVIASWQGSPWDAAFSVLASVFVIVCLGWVLWFWSPAAVDLAKHLWDPKKAAAERAEAENKDGYKAYLLEQAKELVRRKLEAGKRDSAEE